MRLTWLSNAPFTPTGYGVQTELITPRLNLAGHPTAVIPNYGHEGNAITWQGVTIFGKSYHPYCMDILHGCSVTWDADALITLMDLQVMETNMLLGTKWIAWCPVDHLTIPPLIWENLKRADAVVVMSKHAAGEMDKTGKPYNYIPCAVDSKVYKPYPQAEARASANLPQDKFIVGMVAMNKGNPSRKAFQQNITAFAALQKKYGDCVLYLHTADGTRNAPGIDAVELTKFCQFLGLRYGYAGGEDAEGADVIFASQFDLVMGYPSAIMAQLYSSFDVLTAVTLGEGFGIPIVEAQMCGCPVIVGDWTSMPELCFSGWKVDKSEAEPIFTPLLSYQLLPHSEAIAERMEAAYQMRGNQDYRKRASKGAQVYGVDRVFEKYWLSAVQAIGADFQEQTAMPLAKVLQGLRNHE